MKLRQTFLLILLFSSIVVKSQVMWMVIFGDKLSNDKIQSGANISVSLANFVGLSSARYLPSWALGGYTEISLNSHWKLQPEFVFKSPSGASHLESYYQIPGIPDSLVSKSNVYADVISFSVPIYIKYKTKYVGFGIGPQISLAYRAKLIENGETLSGNEIVLKDDFKTYLHKFDFGITTLVEFYLSPKKEKTSMRLGLKYYYGFTPTLKDYPGVHNSVFMLSFGIPIISKKRLKETPSNP